MTKILRSVSLVMTLVIVMSLGFLLVTPAAMAASKSVYVISSMGSPTQIEAWEIKGSPDYLDYEATHSVAGSPGAAVGLAMDSSSATLFITSEGSNTIYLVDAVTFESLGTTTATGASDLAGIVFDHGKNRLYAVDRSTDTLYVYDWNPSTFDLDNETIVALSGTTDAYGIALDEDRDYLFVADRNGTVVNYYRTSDWSLQGSFVPGPTTPRYPTGIAVDYERGLVYTNGATGSGSGHHYLCKYDMGSSTKTEVDTGETLIGLAVDQDTGLIYCTTGESEDDLRVFDRNLNQVFETDLDVGNDPTGLVVPIADIGFGDPLEEEEEEFVEPEPEPAQLLVRNLRITPNELYPNQAVTIDADVYNQGGTHGSRDIQLIINGEFEQRTGVGVSPGTAQSVRFTVYRANPGQYVVTIGEATGWFNVLSAPQLTAAPPPSPQPVASGELGTGGIIAIAVIGVVVVAGIVVAFRLI